MAKKSDPRPGTLRVDITPENPRYWRPNVACDIVLLSLDSKDKLHVLLIKRGKEPYENHWALPGGFLDEKDQSLDAGALRELQEETGVCGVKLRQFWSVGNPYRDPRGYSVSICYLGMVYGVDFNDAKGMDDAKDAKWFKLSNLPLLAFDHADVIDKAKKTLYEWTNGRVGKFI